MAKTGSPCLDICRWDSRTGWCVGCGRTRDEHDRWAKIGPFRQRTVTADLPRRMKRLAALGLAVAPGEGDPTD
ncbi:MAG: DUF1289 domain-containing protein [Alphaproteobacteria bacterium]|nr:DUF1289 domain-containing protein [Alphaproteobacteria bacterium]